MSNEGNEMKGNQCWKDWWRKFRLEQLLNLYAAIPSTVLIALDSHLALVDKIRFREFSRLLDLWSSSLKRWHNTSQTFLARDCERPSLLSLVDVSIELSKHRCVSRVCSPSWIWFDDYSRSIHRLAEDTRWIVERWFLFLLLLFNFILAHLTTVWSCVGQPSRYK